MDNRAEVKAFLSTRRAKITPQRAGLTSYSRNRRVPGLRRSEVADLAGVVEYYAQLQRGNLRGVPDSVLDALAPAVHLDDAERAHLLDLARAAGPAPPRTRRKPPAQQIRPSVARILDGMTEVPAMVNNARLDALAAADPGLSLIAFSARPGSPTDDALRLLASWAATHNPADALASPK